MNEADLRFMLHLIAEGKQDELHMLIKRRLEAITEERRYAAAKQQEQ